MSTCWSTWEKDCSLPKATLSNLCLTYKKSDSWALHRISNLHIYLAPPVKFALKNCNFGAYQIVTFTVARSSGVCLCLQLCGVASLEENSTFDEARGAVGCCGSTRFISWSEGLNPGRVTAMWNLHGIQVMVSENLLLLLPLGCSHCRWASRIWGVSIFPWFFFFFSFFSFFSF